MRHFLIILVIHIILECPVYSYWPPGGKRMRFNSYQNSDFIFHDQESNLARGMREMCATPHGSPGNCIDLHLCPALIVLLKHRPVPNHALRYLRKSSCGFKGFNPLVCCPDPDIRSGPVPNEETTPWSPPKPTHRPRLQTTSSTITTFQPSTTAYPEPFTSEPHPKVTPEPQPPFTSAPRPESTSGPRLGVTTEPHPSLDEHRNKYLLPTENCGSSLEERIIGGQEASLGAYAWIARIGYTRANSERYLYRCGGTLLNSRYVLTAAHCVINLPGGLQLATVRLGEHDETTLVDCDWQEVCADPPQDFSPEKVIAHPEYGVTGIPRYRRDIALIRLDREVTVNSYVHPICLPFGSLQNRNFTGRSSVVAGWGVTDMGRSGGSAVLQYVSLQVVNNEVCSKAFEEHAQIGSDQLCAGGQEGKDSCEGDSGGPLMRPEQGDGIPRYFLIGIVSFGSKTCGTENFPGVYTRVTAYLPWILDSIEP